MIGMYEQSLLEGDHERLAEFLKDTQCFTSFFAKLFSPFAAWRARRKYPTLLQRRPVMWDLVSVIIRERAEGIVRLERIADDLRLSQHDYVVVQGYAHEMHRYILLVGALASDWGHSLEGTAYTVRKTLNQVRGVFKRHEQELKKRAGRRTNIGGD